MGNYLKLVRPRLGGPLRRSTCAGPRGRAVVRIKAIPIAAALLLLLITQTTIGKYNGGIGTPYDPYRIETPEDLNDIGNHQDDWDKNFILVNDVNLAEYTGTQFKIIGPFSGVFDGNNHKILNFTWSSTGRHNIGLFGYVSVGGQIKNLGMEIVDVNGVNGGVVGALVGDNHGTITGCYSTGNVAGQYDVGGLVGTNHHGSTVTNCHSSSRVSGSYVGGLIGFNIGVIANCYSTSSVLGTDYVGGLVGVNDAGEIANCYSIGSVSGRYETGGLVGGNTRMITNCYSSGSVTGKDYVGGLVGRSNGTITKSYSTGRVMGTGYHVGGLLGRNSEGTIEASFWDIETSGQLKSAGGEPKTTAEMKTKNTFTLFGWDFVEVWGIGEHQTYPYLRTEPVGDSNHDKKVDFLDLAILASHWLEEH